MTELKIYNTLSGEKEVFQPIVSDKVGMYVCGPTVYDRCHLGHARCYVTFDIIYRYLSFLGYNVNYVQNITDIDDKLINKVRESGVRGHENIKRQMKFMANDYEEEFFKSMSRLGARRASRYLRATENIGPMVAFITGLMAKGFAYESGGSIYFDVSKVNDYGKLSGKDLSKLRIQIDSPDKRNQLDFVLWKSSKGDEPRWGSPWGDGRPGWHIECSTMSTKEFGSTFDIHGGGQDLIFPHHENEIAQSEAYFGKKFVNYWIHNGFVTVKSEKMSKSEGNSLFLDDIFKRYFPRVVRYFLLSQHYRKPVEYIEGLLEQSKNSLRTIDNCREQVSKRVGAWSPKEIDLKVMADFVMVMNDDFNTARALAVIHGLVKELNSDVIARENMKEKFVALTVIMDIIGL